MTSKHYWDLARNSTWLVIGCVEFLNNQLYDI